MACASRSERRNQLPIEIGNWQFAIGNHENGDLVTKLLQRFQIFDSILFTCYIRARLTVRVRLGKRESKADSITPEQSGSLD